MAVITGTSGNDVLSVDLPIRISVAADGTQGHANSQHAALSADGRFVAFTSDAYNLVSGYINGFTDVFIRDLQTGTIFQASVAADGSGAEGNSYSPSLSADGRFLAFASDASNLTGGDTNGKYDIFVKDLQAGTIIRVSTAASGTQGNSHSERPAISADGRYVTFMSDASNLVSGDTNGTYDIFVKDLQTGTLTLASAAADGSPGNAYSRYGALSADGRYIAFESTASNLVSGDTNNANDIFIKDLQTGAITRVSTAADGSQSNGHSDTFFLSADGRFVAFSSRASNLAGGDLNSITDVFVKDLQTGAITRVSTAVDGLQPYPYSFSTSPVLSADGQVIAFESSAPNLVNGDTNGYYDVFVKYFQPGPGTLIGGAGNDTYVVTAADTMVTEAADEGNDTVRSAISYALTANLENLTLTGSGEINGTGNAFANHIIGNNAVNILDSGDGDDVLLGGAGADTLLGGAGNDTLDGGAGIDVAVFSGNRSLYTVSQDGALAPLQIASAADGIDAVTEVERFVFADGEYTLLQMQSVTGRTLTGGTARNTLAGGFGDDTLIGGSGTDRAEGGFGDDVYVVTKPGVTISEQFNSGTDTVQANISVALQRNVGNLTLTDADAVSGVGNKLDNVLVGNGAVNILSGRRGNDTLLGGGGNDLLVGGEDSDTLTGGAGADTLSGGSGVDVFWYDSASEGGDRIVDFETGQDKLAFNSPNFGSLAAGILSADNFVLDGAATLSQAAFLFNSATHTLSFDADGNGAGAAVEIATVSRRSTVSASDILMMVN